MTLNGSLQALCLLTTIAMAPTFGWSYCELQYRGKPPSACDFVRSHRNRPDKELVVFVGTLLDEISVKTHGKSAKARVEEVLTGIPPGIREVTLDIWAISFGRSWPLEAGSRLVIFGTREKAFNGRVRIDLCGPHFAPAATKLLEAIRSAVSGRPPILIGRAVTYRGLPRSPSEPGPETRITATRGDDVRSSSIGPDGAFEFRNLSPGTWTLHVAGSKYTLPPNQQAGRAVKITSGCEADYFRLWPNGVVEGTVRDGDGRPAAEIPVQLDLSEVTSVDDPDDWNSRRALHFVETTTDSEGRYRFRGLPPGEYLVGINISSEAEEQPWRPLYYPDTPRRIHAKPVKIGTAETLSGIDLTLPPVRDYAQLVVEAEFEDGTPAPDFLGIVIDRVGRRRAQLGRTDPRRKGQNPQAFAVFLGGTYRVKAQYSVQKDPHVPDSPFEVYSGETAGILMEQDGQRVRVVLRRKPGEPPLLLFLTP